MKWKKGDLLLTGCGFPAFVYENQRSKGYISIYAFGIEDEHGSEYPDKAIFAGDKNYWFLLCEERGYSKEYVIEKAKQFKVNL